jgi:hypothetical protein
MGFLSLFNSCGWIFGPAIFLAGLLALGLCLWASFQTRSRRAGYIALAWSASPVLLGVCGALVGLIVVWYAGLVMNGDVWMALGKVPVAGLVVAAPALLWALILLRLRRGVA